MARTKEDALPVDETYRSALAKAIKDRGGQMAVSKLVDIDQATISRNLKYGGRASYTTMKKLADELRLPSPVVPVRDALHEEWCVLGAELANIDEAKFTHQLEVLRALVRSKPQTVPPEKLSDLKSLITNPLPNPRRKRITPT